MPTSWVWRRCWFLLLPLLLAPFFSRSLGHADPPRPQADVKNPGPADLHYVLELATDGERPRFHVDLYFRGNAEGASKLRLPNGWDTQNQLYKAIINLRATSPETKIADTTQPHVKTITYPANQVVHLQSHVIQDWPGAAVRRGLLIASSFRRTISTLSVRHFGFFPIGMEAGL